MRKIRITIYTVGGHNFQWFEEAKAIKKVVDKYNGKLADGMPIVALPYDNEKKFQHIFLPNSIDDLVVEEL